jgi:hypothetical protein
METEAALRLKIKIASDEIKLLREQNTVMKTHLENLVYLLTRFQIQEHYERITGTKEKIPNDILEQFMIMFDIEVEPKIGQVLMDVIPPPARLASKSYHNLRIGTSRSVSFR